MDKILLSLGIASFAFPQGNYMSYVIATITCIAFAMPLTERFSSTKILISITTFLAVTFLLVSAPIATTILAASSLLQKHRLQALSLLILQTSIADTAVALISNCLATYHLEAAAPAILASTLLLCAEHKLITLRTLYLPLILLLALISKNYVSSPALVMLITGIPLIVLSATSLKYSTLKIANIYETVFLSTFIFLLSLSWINTPPRSVNEGYFYLPNATNSPEYKYYENYQEVADFSGLNLKQSGNLKEIPSNSLVVLPWLTEKLPEEFIATLKSLAKSNSWTVVLVGEHTNMNGVADLVNSITNQKTLNDDLSTPPNNQDASGTLREASVKSWRPDSMLNRGASVQINNLTDKVLLSGEGWWAEKNIGEWLWVGDYIWQSTDRNGRLPLASLTVDGNARWIVLGDSTPFLNRVLLSDPRPAKMFMQLATLWPLFIKDALLVLLAFACFMPQSKKRNYLVTIILISTNLVWIANKNQQSDWDSIYIGQSTFDDRNFNTQLSKSKNLLTTEWELRRVPNPLSTDDLKSKRSSVVFGLIAKELAINNVLISDCHRLGNIKTDEGPLLMDAQACKVSGDVEVLIGDKNEAAVFLTNIAGKKVIVVLDQKFLAQEAPIENVMWLEKIIKQVNDEHH
jgi:hypothetical protein